VRKYLVNENQLISKAVDLDEIFHVYYILKKRRSFTINEIVLLLDGCYASKY